MSDTARLPPLLLGLFRELLANGVPLGVRDYLDALRALQLGFGQDGRQALRDLPILSCHCSSSPQSIYAAALMFSFSLSLTHTYSYSHELTVLTRLLYL